MLSPSEAFQQQKPMSEKEISLPQTFRQQKSIPKQEASASVQETATDSTLFTPEKQRLYECRFQEVMTSEIQNMRHG